MISVATKRHQMSIEDRAEGECVDRGRQTRQHCLMRSRLTRSGWILVVGGLVGLAVGVVVSVATDLPLAPEAGALLGVVVAWAVRRMSYGSS